MTDLDGGDTLWLAERAVLATSLDATRKRRVVKLDILLGVEGVQAVCELPQCRLDRLVEKLGPVCGLREHEAQSRCNAGKAEVFGRGTSRCSVVWHSSLTWKVRLDAPTQTDVTESSTHGPAEDHVKHIGGAPVPQPVSS